MARPTSFRLPEELLKRLEQEAEASGTSTTSLVASLLSEGITTRRFAGVVYRNGPTGRRAGLVGGPDVWEVIRDVRRTKGRGDMRLANVAPATGLRRLRYGSPWTSTPPTPMRSIIESKPTSENRTWYAPSSNGESVFSRREVADR